MKIAHEKREARPEQPEEPSHCLHTVTSPAEAADVLRQCYDAPTAEAQRRRQAAHREGRLADADFWADVCTTLEQGLQTD